MPFADLFRTRVRLPPPPPALLPKTKDEISDAGTLPGVSTMPQRQALVAPPSCFPAASRLWRMTMKHFLATFVREAGRAGDAPSSRSCEGRFDGMYRMRRIPLT